MGKYGKNRFVNPYNFVSINQNKLVVGNHDKSEQIHTGYLTCSLTTKTPLAMPDSDYTEDKKGHRYYSFFSYDGTAPVIPGSSLRGSIRKMYEAITDSCFSTTDVDKIITRRSPKPFRPGLLIRDGKGEWKLFSADNHLLGISGKCKKANTFTMSKKEIRAIGFGTKVSFTFQKQEAIIRNRTITRKFVKSISTKNQENKGSKTGYLFVGEMNPNKKYDAIFVQGKEVELLEDRLRLAMKQLQETITLYNDETVNRNLNGAKWYEGYESAYKSGAIPVWYKTESLQNNQKPHVYLSMACIGRVAYVKKMGELIGSKTPCQKREKACKACSLFGMATEEKLGSRIRVTDANLVSNVSNCMMKGITLRELASPKESYLPFYTMLAPGGKVEEWSYDKNALIRGRKFYWHSTSDYYKSEEKTVRNATMDLVKANNEFEFRVFYNGLTKDELDELIWTLTLGENDKQSTLCYKIGHGKPIGLGSVKIRVSSKCERMYQSEGGYRINQTPVETVTNIFKDVKPNHIKDILKISDMKSTYDLGCFVEYPRVSVINPTRQNDGAPHQWFSKNYKLGARFVENMLPKISDNDISLPVYSLENRKGRR